MINQYTIDYGGPEMGTVSTKYVSPYQWRSVVTINGVNYSVRMDGGAIIINPPEDTDTQRGRLANETETGKIIQYLMRLYYPQAVVRSVYIDKVKINAGDIVEIKWVELENGYQGDFDYANEHYTITTVNSSSRLSITMKRRGTLNPVSEVTLSTQFQRPVVYNALSMVGPLNIERVRPVS